MFYLIFAFFYALACPKHSNHTTNHNNTQVSTMDDTGDNGDSSGETGHIPTKPPTNP
jgi:hypothetical protein